MPTAATRITEKPSSRCGLPRSPGTNSAAPPNNNSSAPNDNQTAVSSSSYLRAAMAAATAAPIPTPVARNGAAMPTPSARPAANSASASTAASTAATRPVQRAAPGDQPRKSLAVNRDTASMTSSKSAGDSLAPTDRSTSSSPS